MSSGFQDRSFTRQSRLQTQISTDSVMCLSVVTLKQIYNEKEQAGQGKAESVQFEEERITEKCNKAKSVLKETEFF